jgi:hypothetical protein
VGGDFSTCALFCQRLCAAALARGPPMCSRGIARVVLLAGRDVLLPARNGAPCAGLWSIDTVGRPRWPTRGRVLEREPDLTANILLQEQGPCVTRDLLAACTATIRARANAPTASAAVPHGHTQHLCPHDNVCLRRSGLAIARGQQREEVLVVQQPHFRFEF